VVAATVEAEVDQEPDQAGTSGLSSGLEKFSLGSQMKSSLPENVESIHTSAVQELQLSNDKNCFKLLRTESSSTQSCSYKQCNRIEMNRTKTMCCTVN